MEANDLINIEWNLEANIDRNSPSNCLIHFVTHIAILNICRKGILHECFYETSSSEMMFAHRYINTEITCTTLKMPWIMPCPGQPIMNVFFKYFEERKIWNFGGFTKSVCSFMLLNLDFSSTGVSDFYQTCFVHFMFFHCIPLTFLTTSVPFCQWLWF